LNDSRKALCYFSFVFSMLLCPRLSCAEQTQEEVFPTFEADQFTRREAGKVLSFEGHVRMTYGDASLTADKITFWKEKGIVEAEGKVLFRRGKQFICGDGMTYDVNTGVGTTRLASSAMHPWYGWGEKITRLSPKLYKIDNGYVTTCDYLKPHWKIQAKEILLYLDEKVVAKGAVLYVGKLPLFYIPRYTHHLEDGRFPIGISPGRRSDWGAYLLTAYNAVIKGVKSSFRLDYREKKGFAAGVDAEFRTKGGKGLLEGYYADDRHRQLPNGNIEHDQRYRFHYSQTQDLGADTSAIIEVNKLSDSDFLEDFFRDKYEEEVQPQNFISITKYHPRYTLSLFVRKRLNDFFNVTERLPELSMDFRNQRIPGSPIYYRSINSIADLRQKFAEDSEATHEPQDTLRFDSYHCFSLPRKYFGWLVMVPRLWLRGTYFSRGTDEDNLLRRAAGTELEFFTKIFRTWDVENRRLGIDRLRHVIEPSVTYAFAPDPNVDPGDIFQFDKVDTVDYMNQVRLGVRNKLQTKRKNRTWDFIDLNLYTYCFPTGNPEGNSFSDIFFDLELWPCESFKLEVAATCDPYEETMEEFNTRFTVYHQDKWAANIEHRYLPNESDLLSSEFYYRVNSNWAVKVYGRYEFERGDLEEVEVALWRDFHDWHSSLCFRRREDENQFWVMFSLKGYPETPIASGH